MRHTKGNVIAKQVKGLFLTTLKLIAIALAFSCRVIALFLETVSGILDKATGHGSHH
jgi:hypothetical protein